MSLVGAFLSITCSIRLPCFCFLKISGTYQRIGLELIFICCILLMGLFIMIVGTYVAVMDIMVNLSQIRITSLIVPIVFRLMCSKVNCVSHEELKNTLVKYVTHDDLKNVIAEVIRVLEYS
ncbi:hypothetical protein LIER_43978 [Lithospermum erythrorhizon]|uniref:Uncharacterized protein n=1 Tax=Lithospermum erythrorhizon TaxID=34254 RepID=A0AAV3RHS5_LITER